MPTQLVVDRSWLRALLRDHPVWTNATFAQATGLLVAWVKQWKARFRADPDNPDVIWGKPRSATASAVFSPALNAFLTMAREVLGTTPSWVPA
jgi:hypothetical protein